MRILGVDPGSRITGFGCVELIGKELQHVNHGILRLTIEDKESGSEAITFEDRLLRLYQGLSKVIQELKPQIMVVEKVFFAKNALSALKLGQARGSVLLTGKIHSLEIVEYSPTEVKQAIVGHGRADKEQVAHMVQLLVGQQKFVTHDASDGLALALCHAQMIRHTVSPYASAYALALQSVSRKRGEKKLSLAESVGIRVTKKQDP